MEHFTDLTLTRVAIQKQLSQFTIRPVMELTDVYDSERHLTGKRVPRGAWGSGEYRLIAHVCVFDGDRMLVQRRSMSKSSLPGYWDMSAGGQVDAGESSAEGASREMLEEIGLHHIFDDDDRRITIRFDFGFDDYYTAEYDGSPIVMQESEVSETRWCTCEEICGMISDRTFIQYRESFIRRLFELRHGGRDPDLQNDDAFYSFDRYTEPRT